MAEPPSLTALVADPDDAVAARLVEILSASGVEVVDRATTGTGAIEVVTDLVPDAVLLDPRIADPDGPAVCEQLQQRAPATAIAVIAKPSDLDLAYRALRGGAAAVMLREPTIVPLLAQTVRAATRGESVVPGPLATRLLADLGTDEHTDRLDGLRRPPTLTATEREVLGRLAAGETAEAIALRHDVTARLVCVHVGYAVTKLHQLVERRTEPVPVGPGGPPAS